MLKKSALHIGCAPRCLYSASSHTHPCPNLATQSTAFVVLRLRAAGRPATLIDRRALRQRQEFAALAWTSPSLRDLIPDESAASDVSTVLYENYRTCVRLRSSSSVHCDTMAVAC